MTVFCEGTDFCQLIRSKNHQAFHNLYEQYSPALFNEILRSVKHYHIAEDLLQDVFLNIYQHANEYDPKKGRLFTWMITITRNKCTDYLRSVAHRRSKQVIELTENVSVANSSVNSVLEFKQVYKRIVIINPPALKLIELLYVQGFTHDEAAAICNMPVGTLKTRIRKVLLDLRKKLHDFRAK